MLFDKDACRQRLDGVVVENRHGVRITGATVHLVTSELDGGPIVSQAAVPVLDDDTVETLSARILVEEHRIYPEAIALRARGRLVDQPDRRFLLVASRGRGAVVSDWAEEDSATFRAIARWRCRAGPR